MYRNRKGPGCRNAWSERDWNGMLGYKSGKGYNVRVGEAAM